MKKYLLALTSMLIFSKVSAEQVHLNKADYAKQMRGFWLGQSIANWTGLITEMDKIGTPETLPFYTDNDWGKADQKAFWGEYVPHASTIDFYFETTGTPWGADDDTDIEYMYLHLHHQYKAQRLSAEQIRQGWLTHTYSENDAPLYKKFPTAEPVKENFLWVSNERARILMQGGMQEGMLPPQTSEPEHNPHYNMIDAQLTTELFGLLVPGNVPLAIKTAELAVRTSASHEAESIANFYIAMHALAPVVDKSQSMQAQTIWLADNASAVLDKNQFPYKMYQFVKKHYQKNPDKTDWEATRDAIYQRYQRQVSDGYQYQKPFDAGINFAASLVSLFYGHGDIKETIRIGSLTGWDSDNPTATWGGLLGFMLGADKVKQRFNQPDLSETYWIHRTRRNFPDHTPKQKGEDTFPMMAERSVKVIDRILGQQAGDYWVVEKQL